MSAGGGPRTRWREYLEDHALQRTTVISAISRLAPEPPDPAVRRTAAPTLPPGRHKVTVVVPCYNYGRFLPDAVESAVSQTGVDVEVLIVDDRSTDDSLAVAQRLADKDSRVTVLANTVNSGHVRSFNRGWEAGTGEFVVKLDADDLLTPGSLARAVALFTEYPHVGLVYGHPRHFWSPEPPVARGGEIRWTIWHGSDWLAERCRRGSTAITNPEMVLRSSLLSASGPMNPDIPYGPDMEISLRMAALSDVGRVGGADQALHREHPASMSVTEAGDVLVDLDARLMAFETALAAVPDLGRRAALEQTARRAVAGHALRYADAARDRGRPASESGELLQFARSLLPADERRRAEPWPSATSDGAVRDLVSRAARLGRKARRALHDEALHTRWTVSGV